MPGRCGRAEGSHDGSARLHQPTRRSAAWLRSPRTQRDGQARKELESIERSAWPSDTTPDAIGGRAVKRHKRRSVLTNSAETANEYVGVAGALKLAVLQREANHGGGRAYRGEIYGGAMEREEQQQDVRLMECRRGSWVQSQPG